MLVVETKDLVKRYGPVEALRGVSVRVARGEIFGLLGQNGAGKTTLIKVLLGLTRPSSGRAALLDEPAGTAAARQRVGYLPEDHRFPEYHTGRSLLDFYGQLLGMPGSTRRARIPAVLERVGIAARMDFKVRTYSKGMKQRLGIAQAILHEPEALFLDEPTDGVDPVGRREIRALLQELRGRGTTIFLNSHLLSEVERLCDRVCILNAGQVVREGSVEELTRQQGVYEIGLADDQTLPLDDLRRLGYQATRAGARWEVRPPPGQTIDPVLDLLRQRGLVVRHLAEKRQSLEDLFVEMVDDAER